MRSSLVFVTLSCFLTVVSIGCGGGGQGVGPAPTPTPAPNTVAIAFPVPTPVAVAEKIGNGNWTATSLPSNGTLVLQVPSGTTQYGVALLCNTPLATTQANIEWIIEADTKDGTSFTAQLCSAGTSTPPPANISGSFDATAFPTTASVMVSTDSFSRNAGFSTATGAFNIAALSGITDIYVTAFDASNNMLATKIVRSQPVPGIANGGNTITLAAGDATTLQPLLVANIPPAPFNPPIMVPFPMYVSAQGGVALSPGFPTSSQYAVFPASQAQPGDYYFFNAISGASNLFMSTKQYLLTAGPVTLTLPNPWTPKAPTPAAFPTFIFDYTGFAGQPAVASQAAISWSQVPNTFSIIVVATSNHQNGATTLTIPDLTAVPGFFPLAPSGTTINWASVTWGGTAQSYVGTTVRPQTISEVAGNGSFIQP